MNPKKINTWGYAISVIGVAILLVWIGIFKYTPTEAAAIKPLVENHFLMSWLYTILSEQAVSTLIGIVEIIVGLALVVSLKVNALAKYAGIASTIIFIVTLSFLLTTPGVFKVVDGVPITEFFILKDIPSLGISLLVFARGLKR